MCWDGKPSPAPAAADPARLMLSPLRLFPRSVFSTVRLCATQQPPPKLCRRASRPSNRSGRFRPCLRAGSGSWQGAICSSPLNVASANVVQETLAPSPLRASARLICFLGFCVCHWSRGAACSFLPYRRQIAATAWDRTPPAWPCAPPDGVRLVCMDTSGCIEALWNLEGPSLPLMAQDGHST